MDIKIEIYAGTTYEVGEFDEFKECDKFLKENGYITDNESIIELVGDSKYKIYFKKTDKDIDLKNMVILSNIPYLWLIRSINIK